MAEFSSPFAFCPITSHPTYTLWIVSPTSEELSVSSTTGFTFDADSLVLTASGSIDYKDSSGAGFNGQVDFELCVATTTLCS